ncbi:MAG: hypothetical protein U7M05_10930 [Candidatus Igneacidithiobacillus chanchocoensis]
MAVTENTRAEQDQDVDVGQFFDAGRFCSRALSAIWGIQAIADIMRGDTSNFGSVQMDGSPAPQLSRNATGGLIEALTLLSRIVEVELEELEARQ